MSHLKTFAANSILPLSIAGVVVALLIPTPYGPCAGNPDEFALKRLAARYHYFFAKHKRSPSNAHELAAFVPGDLGPYVSADSLDCNEALDEERGGLMFVQWDAAIAPESETNSTYILAYRVAPEAEGRWAVRGDASPVYLSPDEFANIKLVPVASKDDPNGG